MLADRPEQGSADHPPAAGPRPRLACSIDPSARVRRAAMRALPGEGSRTRRRPRWP